MDARGDFLFFLLRIQIVLLFFYDLKTLQFNLKPRETWCRLDEIERRCLGLSVVLSLLPSGPHNDETQATKPFATNLRMDQIND